MDANKNTPASKIQILTNWFRHNTHQPRLPRLTVRDLYRALRG